MNNRKNTYGLKNINNLMLRLPKYKYYYTAINLLVIASSFTFFLSLFFSFNQHPGPFPIVIVLLLILSVFLLAFIALHKSGKFYKTNVVRNQSPSLLSTISHLFVRISGRKHGKNLLIVGNGKSG